MHLLTRKQQKFKHILDAKYSKAYLKTIAESSTRIYSKERNQLYTLLNQYEFLFEGNLGTRHCKPYGIKLKPDTKQYHIKPFPVPRIHEITFNKELNRLEALKIINKVKRSQ